jgi:hypothetical protein
LLDLGRGVQPFGDLPHDGDCDLRRRNRADIKADRRMNARNIRFAQALRLEPIDAAGVGFSRAQRADVKTIPRQRVAKRGIVDYDLPRLPVRAA